MSTFKSCKEGKHKYKARYDEVPNTDFLNVTCNVGGFGDFREIIVLKKYVHDVCIRCGKIVHR